MAGNLTFGIRIALNAENSSHARAEARPADRRRRAIEIAPDVREKHLAVAVGLAPAGLVGLIFVVIPLAISLYVSLWEWPLLRPGRAFLGLGNYARLLQTPDFWRALRVTLPVSYTHLTLPTIYSV